MGDLLPPSTRLDDFARTVEVRRQNALAQSVRWESDGAPEYGQTLCLRLLIWFSVSVLIDSEDS